MNVDKEELLQFHNQLLADDPTASAQIFIRVLPALTSNLKYKSKQIYLPDEDAEDIASEVLYDYIDKPGQYDPQKSNLLTYLTNVGQRDLIDLKRKNDRRRELDKKNFEFGQSCTNNDIERLIDQLTGAKLRSQLLEVAKTNEEAIVLELMIDGERKTDVYVKAIGITDLDQITQRKKIKQLKDRLEKRLLKLSSEIL